ncbi:MAG TPA: VOC family protein [Candidatus Limnocylindria bacterium]|nr:VOC family protein [Candidatus Limnocylindria bacterium]
MPRFTWGAETVSATFDHMVLGVDDLDRGIAFMEERAGVRAIFGGVHPGRGTQNALLSLGTRRYLEIIAPDPKQSVTPWVPGLSEMREPRLVAWAAHTDDIAGLAQKVKVAGFSIEGPSDGSRARPDGKILHWKSFRLADDRGGLLPFFIEWSHDSVHPSVDAPAGCRLTHFFAVNPEPKDLAAVYNRLGVEIAVELGEKAQLRAQVASAKGKLELTS